MIPSTTHRRAGGHLMRRMLVLAALATSQLSAPGLQAQPSDSAQVLFPTRQSMLDAAQAGQLSGLGNASSDDMQKMRASIYRILTTEYRVPPLSKECFDIGVGFSGDVQAMLNYVTSLHVMTLSDQAPHFSNPANEQIKARLERHAGFMQSNRDKTTCDSLVMGKVVLNPYKAALLSLMNDYSKATQAYVEGERARRQTAYREAAGRKQQQEQQQQTANRAAEQQRIDAEAARIKQDELRRQQKEKSRVGG